MATWSVVGKNKKKAPSQSLTKAQKKQLIENMPKIAPLDPVKEDTTIYDAFIKKEEQRYEKKQQEKLVEKVEAGKVPNGKGTSDVGAKKKPLKKKPMEQAQKKRPFEEEIKEVLEEDLKSVLLQSKGYFPDKPELWLKDLVTSLNEKFENCPETDTYLQKEHTDYPASLLKKGCTKLLKSVLKDCNAAILDHVLLFCIHKMLEECQNGHATYGYKIFLQLLIRGSPDIVMSNLSQLKDIVKNNHSRPESCLMLMWVLGQVGYPSLKAGVRVWLDVKQPCLGMKALCGYCLLYLQTLLSLHHKDLLQAAGEIKLREYFYLLDTIYGHVLPGDLRKQLKELYPQLKIIAQGKDLSSNLRTFFPSYLTRAKPDAEKDYRKEVISSVMECLSKDKQTFSLWIQLYPKHLTQTKVLLEYMSENFEAVRGSLDLKLLKQTLMTFMRTNEELGQGKNAADMEALTALCEELLRKLSKPKFSWRWLIVILVSMVTAVVVYDLHSSKNPKESRTVRFLEAYGILHVLREIWSWMSHYAGVCVTWLMEKLPVFYDKTYTVVVPVLVRIEEVMSHAWNNTGDVLKHVGEKVYNWAPDMWTEVGIFCTMCWDYILEYTYWIYGHILVLYGNIRLWVEINILHGDFSAANVTEKLTSFIETVQTAVVTFFQWCQNMVVMLVNWCLGFWRSEDVVQDTVVEEDYTDDL